MSFCGKQYWKKTLNEGDIKLKNWKVEIEDTAVKKQKGWGTVIENGGGKFLKSTFMDRYNAILFQAGIAIKKCNVSHCEYGMPISKRISDPVVLESNSFT